MRGWMKMVDSVGPGWIRSTRDALLAGLVTMTLLVDFWLAVRLVADDHLAHETLVTELAAGGDTVLSRCADCTQPGDMVTVFLRGAPTRLNRIAVFHDGRLSVTCSQCSSLSYVLPLIGSYMIVGLDLSEAEDCPANSSDLDIFVSGMRSCGARVIMEHVETR